MSLIMNYYHREHTVALLKQLDVRTETWKMYWPQNSIYCLVFPEGFSNLLREAWRVSCCRWLFLCKTSELPLGSSKPIYSCSLHCCYNLGDKKISVAYKLKFNIILSFPASLDIVQPVISSAPFPQTVVLLKTS